MFYITPPKSLQSKDVNQAIGDKLVPYHVVYSFTSEQKEFCIKDNLKSINAYVFTLPLTFLTFYNTKISIIYTFRIYNFLIVCNDEKK